MQRITESNGTRGDECLTGYRRGIPDVLVGDAEQPAELRLGPCVRDAPKGASASAGRWAATTSDEVAGSGDRRESHHSSRVAVARGLLPGGRKALREPLPVRLVSAGERTS